VNDATRQGSKELLSGTITLFFTDVEQSTELLRAVGAEQYSLIVDKHREIVRGAVIAAGGREVDSRGEELFAVFARAADAVQAALRIEREHREANWPGDASVRVRIGIHVGAPVLHEGGYLGLDVHRAARICAAGHGGQVLLSNATADLLAGAWPVGTSAESLGEYELKGLGGPEQIFQVVAPDLQESFPPLRVATTEPGRFVEEDHGKLVEAARSAATPRRLGRLLHVPGRHHQNRGQGVELAWEARDLIARTPQEAREPLAELGTELFTAARLGTDVDRFLESVDRKRLDRRLTDYREMAVVSKRAQAELEALSSQLRSVEALAQRRERLHELERDIGSTLKRLASERYELPAVRSHFDALQHEIQRLGDELQEARREVGSLGLKLERTHHHGIYRHGRIYVVPEFDELGIEHHREFDSLQDALAHRKALEVQESREGKLTGAPHDYGPAMQRYMPVRDDKP
jgi:class 3 adenylate cyclase